MIIIAAFIVAYIAFEKNRTTQLELNPAQEEYFRVLSNDATSSEEGNVLARLQRQADSGDPSAMLGLFNYWNRFPDSESSVKSMSWSILAYACDQGRDKIYGRTYDDSIYVTVVEITRLRLDQDELARALLMATDWMSNHSVENVRLECISVDDASEELNLSE